MQESREKSISEALYRRAAARMPGGVSSPVRSFRSVGGLPLIASHGRGSRIWDVDGNEYIDYILSYGPLIFGHAPPEVTAAIQAAAALGTTFGQTTAGEVELAELICRLAPSIEKVRFVNSGTEAVMSAVRAARGYTGRDKIVKFEGCYHGHSDGLLAKAGSGVATLGLPDSAGVPESVTRDTIVAPYNDTGSFAALMSAHGGEIAAVLVEPVAANMGVVLPAPGFLETLRAETSRCGAVLIFDEIITGFRLALGGAQEVLGIAPDMTTLGKIVGGGLPLAAYGGRADIMDMVAPVGPVYQAGTLSGNPIAVSAGLAALRRLESAPGLYDDLAARMEALCERLQHAASRSGAGATINRIGSIATVFFSSDPVSDYAGALRSDRSAYARYFAAAYEAGVLLAPSQFEAMFLSTSHTDGDVSRTAEILAAAIAAA